MVYPILFPNNTMNLYAKSDNIDAFVLEPQGRRILGSCYLFANNKKFKVFNSIRQKKIFFSRAMNVMVVMM